MRVLLVVCGVLVLATSALAAGSVRVFLTGPRAAPIVGQRWNATLSVRPRSFRGEVRLTAVGPTRVVARASRRKGSYRARLVFPAAGRWKLTARAGGSTSQLGVVTVRRLPPLRFVWPTSVDLQPDGSLLVVENGRARILAVGAGRGGTRVVGSGWEKPFEAARAPSGTIYVSDGRSLKRLEGSGGPQTVATVDEDIGPIAIADNGDVFYVTRTRLFRLRPGGAPQTVATDLTGPHGVAVAADGSVLVSDTGTDRVLRIDPESGAATRLISIADPRGIDVAPDGTIYVVESEAKRVGHFGADGARLRPVGPAFGDPYDLVAGPGGVVYVVDTAAAGVIRRVAPGGKTVTIPTG
jgi:streptogramin lyase